MGIYNNPGRFIIRYSSYGLFGNDPLIDGQAGLFGIVFVAFRFRHIEPPCKIGEISQ
jgi:hypothetical protein